VCHLQELAGVLVIACIVITVQFVPEIESTSVTRAELSYTRGYCSVVERTGNALCAFKGGTKTHRSSMLRAEHNTSLVWTT